MCVVVKDRFKDCCAQKRDRLCGASLLVRVGSPMIVLQTCTPYLKDIWPGSIIKMRSIRHLWPLCWCCGPGLCAYGRKRPSVPGLFCQWWHWARKEYDVWTGLTLPSCKSTKSMYGTNFKNIQVLGQLNHKCGMTSQMRSFRIGKNLSFCNIKNWFTGSRVCVRLFWR